MERQLLSLLAWSVIMFFGGIISRPLLVAESHDHQEEANHDEHKDGEGDHEESSPKFGPGKAILAVRNEGKAFQLSEESIKFLKIEFSSPQWVSETKSAAPLLKIPRAALVSFQEKMGVYIQDEKWIQLVPVKIIKKIDGHVLVQAEQLHSDALIATKGAQFVRTAHLEAAGQGGEGHAH